MTLGEIIRNLRKQNNMSQEQLAEKLDVSRQSVSLWEKDATQPTIDNIITLSDIFGVTVDELLKSDVPVKAEEIKNSADDVDEKRLFKRQLFIALIDLTVLGVGVYMTWFCASGTEDFLNVLDLHFNSANVAFIEISPFFIGALSVLYLLTGVFAFVKKKPFKVVKTILIMLIITLFAAINLVGASIDESRQKNVEDAIPEGVSYLDIRAFESIDTLSEYEEQYVQGQTDGEIPVNYSVWQDYLGNSAYTQCVEFKDSADKNSELSRYWLELEIKHDEESEYFTDKECAELGVKKCAYYINKEGKYLSLYIIKGSRVYYCSYDNIGEINDAVKEQIKKLQ